MAKTKKIFGLFLLSMVGAYSAIIYGVNRSKRQLQEEYGYDEKEAETRLLEIRNDEIKKKQEDIRSSKNLFQKIRSIVSLFFLESEKVLID